MSKQYIDTYTRKFSVIQKSQDEIRNAQKEIRDMVMHDVGSDPVMMQLLATAISAAAEHDLDIETTQDVSDDQVVYTLCISRIHKLKEDMANAETGVDTNE